LIQYKYNEEEYAKQIEKNGFLTKYHMYELTILVKYWKSQGIKPKQRKEMAYKFCEKYIENFNKVKYFRKINTVLRNGSKKNNPLIIIKEIPITDAEIEYINNLDIDYNYKKVLFTLLVNNKIKKEVCKIRYGDVLKFNYVGGKQKYFNDIFEMSKIPNTYKINNIMNYLSNNGYIDIRTKGKINLLFVESIESSNKIVFNITTFDNIGYYFDWYNEDEKIIRCEDCGKLIKQTSNRRKYCSSCWKEYRRKYKTEKQRIYRKRNTVDS
jgi:hypothetical protein